MCNTIKLITHTDLDGVSCAILAKLAFGNHVEIEYCDYSDMDSKFKDVIEELKTKPQRYFVTDLNLSESLISQIDEVNKDKNLLLFDHHQSSLPFGDKDWICAADRDENDNPVCGTSLFYGYLKMFPGGLHYVCDKFVEYVTYWDTWQWENKGADGDMSKNLSNLLSIYGRDSFLSKMVDHLSKRASNFKLDKTDVEVLDIREAEMRRYISDKNHQLKCFVVDNYTVGVVFAERFISQLGNELCRRNPDIDFAAIVQPAYNTVSLRSIKDVDLSEFAKRYGGGGHKLSAGMPYSEDLNIELVQSIFGNITLKN